MRPQAITRLRQPLHMSSSLGPKMKNWWRRGHHAATQERVDPVGVVEIEHVGRLRQVLEALVVGPAGSCRKAAGCA